MFHHVELWGYPKKMWRAGSNHLCAQRSIGFQHHLAAQCHLFDLFVAQKINVLGGARDRKEHVHAPTHIVALSLLAGDPVQSKREQSASQ